MKKISLMMTAFVLTASLTLYVRELPASLSISQDHQEFQISLKQLQQVKLEIKRSLQSLFSFSLRSGEPLNYRGENEESRDFN